MVMKDIEALMEKAKNGDQSAFGYLYDNSLGVFAPDFKDDDKLSDFLEECVNAGIDLMEYIDSDILILLAEGGNQWAFDYLNEKEYLWIEKPSNIDFFLECENNGVDIGCHEETICSFIEYGDNNLINHFAELGAYKYLDVDDLTTYDWVEKHLEGNDEVAEIASKHLSEVFQYKEDIWWLKEQADKKIPQAQYLLGLLYLGEGSLIEKNESLAIRYLKAAEEGGCKLTKEYLKEIEEEEERKKIEQEQAKILAEKRAEESRKLIEKAEKGELEVEELVKLAIDLAYGDKSKGIRKNVNKATKLFRMAAEQGCPEAQCQLGIRMIEGTGCRKNWNAGIKWLKKALKGGYEPAKTYLSEYDTLFNRMLHKFIK